MKSLLLLSLVSALTAGQAFAQTAGAPTEFANAAQPQLTAGTDGRVFLVYGQPIAAPTADSTSHEHHKAAHAEGKKGKRGHGPTGRSGDLYVTSSKDGGVTFAPAVKVAHVPNLMLGGRRGPRIVAHGDHLTVTAVGDELIAYSSNDGGATWSEPVAVNDVPTSAREGLHDLAGAPDGEVFITWLDLRNGKMELWGASSMDGGRTWGKNQLVYKSPDKSICECCHPSALYDAQGNLAVMWRNSIEGSRDMWLTTRLKGSRKFTSARKLGAGTWKINGCPHDGGTILPLGNGKFGAVWQREGEVFMIRDEAEVSLGKGRQPVAVKRDKRAFVVWHDGKDLVAHWDSPGAKPVKQASDARFPSIIALRDGKSAVLAYERAEKGTTSIAVERL